MTLHWFIDSRRRLVTITADGAVSRAEIDEMLDAVMGAGALAYRKLVDVTAGRSDLSEHDMLEIGARVRTLHGNAVGAVALVLPNQSLTDEASSEAETLVARLIGIIASAKRPFRICKTVGSAKRWLESPAVRDG
jgi:hypothetical protein